MSFNPDRDIPVLSNKTILVTGGSDGLGKESLYQLSKHSPSRIYLAARNKVKAENAIAEIKSKVPNANVEFLQLDLASFDSIKSAAKTFDGANERLDILMNNGGVMAVPPGQTKEGYEIQFGTNHVGHALFTTLLLPKLKATAKEPGSDVRIINLSSGAHRRAPTTGYRFNEMKTEMKSISTFERYSWSKLANIHWNRELATRNPDITCVAIHPGVVQTNLMSGPYQSFPLFSLPMKAVSRLFFKTVEQGAYNQLWAATAPKDKVKTGTYYVPVAAEGQDTPLARDDKEAAGLWSWTEEQLKGHV